MTNKQLKEMANRIKERRVAFGYTQESFSELIDISGSSYTKIENAFQKPSLDTVIKIAVKLDMSIDYIIFGSVEKAPKKVDDTEMLTALLDFVDSGKLQHVGEVINRLSKIKDTSDRAK